jgi:hypothetical protein
LEYILEILLLAFIIISFLFSAIEKTIDWKGQLKWFQNHFKGTILMPQIHVFLIALIILDFAAAILGILGVFDLLSSGSKTLGLYAHIIAAITILCMLIGQRIVKDYPGSSSLVSYFMVVIFGVYIFTQS